MTPDKLTRLRELAEKIKGWMRDGSAWPHPEHEGVAIFGHTDEDGTHFEIGEVDTGNYDQDQDALPLAQYIAAANPFTVLALIAENERLSAIINTPQANDFLRAVSTEAEHQRQRWSSEHDAGKNPADWFWLVGYLAGKALHAHASGNTEKAEHHVITTAAACANWHLAMHGKTSMRPGIDPTTVPEAHHA